MRLPLTEHLRAFDSHERAILLQAATGGDFVLSDDFRHAIAGAVGLTPPPEAFVAMDYTIDWLYAALCSASGPLAPTIPRPDGNQLTGSIEDIDLVVAWENGARTHLVLIEAKGFTGWTNKQMSSKISRLDLVLAPFLHEVDVHLILTGPSPSAGLDISGWPAWARPDGKSNFLELPDPGPRLAIQRCDEAGTPTKTDWTHWRVVSRSWKAATIVADPADSELRIPKGEHPVFGEIVVTKRAVQPPGSKASFMAERHRSSRRAWPTITPPGRPEEWESFLTAYFGDGGVWFMEATDGDPPEIDETGYIGVKCCFSFGADGAGVYFELTDATGGPPMFFNDLRGAAIIEPGVVAIRYGSRVALLDGHLTSDDRDEARGTGAWDSENIE